MLIKNIRGMAELTRGV
ncbi:hypothetical protein SAMN02787074_1057 [Chryseobacterium sp. YR221]|nr:hypothetical protein SAMN02787074_1057 [Chryseobacterium sp. YR221]